jgi:hypothetical protein
MAYLAKHMGEQEFEGVYVKKNDEEQAGIEKYRELVVQAVAAEEHVVRVPEGEQHDETNCEGNEAANGFVKVAEIFGNFQGDNQQRKGESEDNITEGIDTRQSGAAHAKAIFSWGMIEKVHANSPVKSLSQGRRPVLQNRS